MARKPRGMLDPERIRAMYAEGMSITKIATALGVTGPGVAYHLKQSPKQCRINGCATPPEEGCRGYCQHHFKEMWLRGTIEEAYQAYSDHCKLCRRLERIYNHAIGIECRLRWKHQWDAALFAAKVAKIQFDEMRERLVD